MQSWRGRGRRWKQNQLICPAWDPRLSVAGNRFSKQLGAGCGVNWAPDGVVVEPAEPCGIAGL